jgi:hypothetical protein
MTTIDFKALGALAASTGSDMTVASKGGGDYKPVAAGLARARLVAYVETGREESEFSGVKKVQPMASLVFELSGPKHPGRTLDDGTLVPDRITVELAVSLNEKANMFKVFKAMNYNGTAKHMAQLIGESFLVTVFHREYKRKDGSDGVAVSLKNDSGYSIRAPRYEDPDTGDIKVVEVAPMVSTPRVFLWDHASLEQWESLFIEGEYPARTDDKGAVIAPARSKNVFQNQIRAAVNFKGSPIQTLLDGGSLDVPGAEAGKAAGDAAASDEALLEGITQ